MNPRLVLSYFVLMLWELCVTDVEKLVVLLSDICNPAAHRLTICDDLINLNCNVSLVIPNLLLHLYTAFFLLIDHKFGFVHVVLKVYNL